MDDHWVKPQGLIHPQCWQLHERMLNNLVVDPAFLAIMRFPLKRRDSFFYLKQKKKPFLENGLESPLIFVFILKGKTK